MKELIVLSASQLTVEGYKKINPNDINVMKYSPINLDNLNIIFMSIINTAKAFGCEKITFKVGEALENYNEFMNALENEIHFVTMMFDDFIKLEIKTGAF